MLIECPEILNEDIIELFQNKSFFINVETINTLLDPVKSAVKAFEFKSTSLADCFIELIKLFQ